MEGKAWLDAGRLAENDPNQSACLWEWNKTMPYLYLWLHGRTRFLSAGEGDIILEWRCSYALKKWLFWSTRFTWLRRTFSLSAEETKHLHLSVKLKQFSDFSVPCSALSSPSSPVFLRFTLNVIRTYFHRGIWVGLSSSLAGGGLRYRRLSSLEDHNLTLCLSRLCLDDQGRISLLAMEANGGVYQSVHGKHSHLWLLLIKHDIPLKSAVFHAGTWGGTICTPYAEGRWLAMSLPTRLRGHIWCSYWKMQKKNR